MHIVFDLDNWSNNPMNNFTLKNCLLCPNNIAKSNNKSKYVYSSYGISFDGLGSWSFGKDFAKNFIIFWYL